MTLIKISIVLLLIFTLEALSMKLKRDYTPQTCHSSSFVPVKGGNYGRWDRTRRIYPFRSSIEFLAQGNDIYLAVFENNNTRPTEALVISGFSNGKTKFYTDGGLDNDVCAVNMTIQNVTAFNTFRAEFDVETHSVNLWYNGKNYLNCLKSKLDSKSEKVFVFSQWADNVKICDDVQLDQPMYRIPDTCKSSFYYAIPEGNNGIWSKVLRYPFKSNFEFLAKGNDIYVAIFEDDNLKPTEALVISGFSNTQTKFYNDGGLQNDVCTVKMQIYDVAATNTFRVEFNAETHNVGLWYNDRNYLNNCNKSKLTSTSKKTFVFSQYALDVQICQDVKVDQPMRN